MKRFIPMLVFIILLSACGARNEKSANPPEPSLIVESTPTPTPTPLPTPIVESPPIEEPAFDPSFIDKNLDVIMDNREVSRSSNPGDYIRANQALYDEIINSGEQGLTYLVETLKQNGAGGLKAWIMAKACEDILKDQAPDLPWATAQEWLANYEATRNS